MKLFGFTNEKPAEVEPKAEHEHSVKIMKVQNLKVRLPIFGGEPGDATSVLMLCEECKVPQTLLLIGTWSLDEVRGTDAKDVAASLIAETGGKA